MDFKKYIENAWGLTIDHIASLIILTLVMFVIWILTAGILAPVTLAGYTQSLLLMIREKRDPRIQDLFSQFRLFLPLLGFAVVVFIGIMVGFMFLFFPGLIIALLVSFACLYMIPLMTDQDLPLFDAIKKSYAMSMEGELLDNIIVLIIYLGINMIGSSVFIGSLFTQPLATLFLLTVFIEKTGKTAQPVEPAGE